MGTSYDHNYLMLFTINPVQAFVEQARKSQDLYWGSFLLSYLSWKGIQLLCDKYGEDNIIFPSLKGQPLFEFWEKGQGVLSDRRIADILGIPTIPNRFLALIPEGKPEELKELGREIEKNIREEFICIGQRINKELDIPFNNEQLRQLEDCFSYYWAAVPLDSSQNNGGNGYADAYERVERLLGVRKNIRDFTQLKEAAGVKCNICGQRNVLFFKSLSAKSEVQKNTIGTFSINRMQKNEGAVELPDVSEKYLKRGEGICAVCFTKRCAEKYFMPLFDHKLKEDFPSNAMIALLPYLKKVKSSLVATYKDLLKDKFDEQLLYEENVTQSYFIKNQIDINVETARRTLADILEDGKRKGIKQTKYYAVIMLDGDNMGKWIREGDGGSLDPDTHRRISDSLKNYSLECARDIVEKEQRGRLIYSGGDDVLAMVNLEALFDVMIELRAAFSGHIGKDGGVDFTMSSKGEIEKEGYTFKVLGSRATASMGVCISHYKIPFWEVINMVRKQEKKAKEIDAGKNAFAIALLRHNGEIKETRGRWFEEGMLSQGTIGMAKKVLNELIGGNFTVAFVYTLRKEIMPLMNSKGKFIDDNCAVREGILGVEIKRLLSRACNISKDKNETSKEYLARCRQKVDELTDLLIQTFVLSGDNMESFLSLLEIVAFIYKEVGEIEG